MQRTDPITFEVLRNAFVASAEEMKATLLRTAHSSIIYEVQDMSTGLFNSKGELVAQTTGMAIFLGTLSLAVEAAVKKFGLANLHPGDIIVTNDPYIGGGTHLNDVTMISPVYYAGILLGFTGCRAHWTEIGGKNPGGVSTDSLDIYQEGLQFPIVKLFQKGTPNETLIDMIRVNVRAPEMTLGDMYAEMAACRIGERRLQEMTEKYNVKTIQDAMDDILDHGERITRMAIQKIPDGEYNAEDYLDDDGTNDNSIPVKVKVTVKDDKLHFDFTGSGISRGPVSCGYSTTLSACRVILKAITEPALPPNEGCYRPLTITAPHGTVVNVARPTPVCIYWEGASRVIDVVWRALAAVIPEKLPAGHLSSLCVISLSGFDARTGKPFYWVQPEPGGWGAGKNIDGDSGQIALVDGDAYNIPVEVIEKRYPVLIERYALNTDSGGLGHHRGGLGIIRDIRIETEQCQLVATFERHKFPPFGLNGGKDGAPNSIYINPGRSDVTIGGKIHGAKLHRGDLVRVATGGGGGYGDPANRDRNLFRRDLKDGYISVSP